MSYPETPITVIEAGSDAFYRLEAVLADRETYKVSIDHRGDGIAIKRNEGMWTATLSTTSREAKTA